MHERKSKCLHNLTANKTLASELDAIKQAVVGYKSKLKKDNIDFLFKTLDGDEAKWKAIQLECDALLSKIKPIDTELSTKIIRDPRVEFKPSTQSIQDMCGRLEVFRLIDDSMIINDLTMENNLLKLCKLSGKQFKLLYRASRDGFAASNFHAKCDNQPGTLTIIKTTKGYIFGGYTAVASENRNRYKSDNSAFLFSLVNARSLPLLMPVKVRGENAIVCHVIFGPMFGGDLVIAANSNTNAQSKSNLGSNFDFTHFAFQSTEARSFLAGGFNFQTVEIEVYQCEQQNKIYLHV